MIGSPSRQKGDRRYVVSHSKCTEYGSYGTYHPNHPRFVAPSSGAALPPCPRTRPRTTSPPLLQPASLCCHSAPPPPPPSPPETTSTTTTTTHGRTVVSPKPLVARARDRRTQVVVAGSRQAFPFPVPLPLRVSGVSRSPHSRDRLVAVPCTSTPLEHLAGRAGAKRSEERKGEKRREKERGRQKRPGRSRRIVPHDVPFCHFRAETETDRAAASRPMPRRRI